MADIKYFESKEKACEFLTKHTIFTKEFRENHFCHTGTYYLSYGEYEAPTAILFHTKKGIKIKLEYFYFPNIFNAKKDHFLTDDDFLNFMYS